jgi:methionyl-tRNA formyltransferase
MPYIQGKIKPKTQDEAQATYTKLVTKQDGFIDLTGRDPVDAERFVRAMQPWPGAWTEIKLQSDGVTKRLKLLKSHLDENGKLVLDEVQLEGKDPVSYKQFKEAYPDALPI